MNPYTNLAYTYYDLPLFTADAVASLPSAPIPHFNLALLPTNQLEQFHGNHLHQMDESELRNPYISVDYPSSVTFHNQTAHNSTLVQSGSLNKTENANDFLSGDPTDQSDISNTHRLSVVSSQNPDLECYICFSQFNNGFRCPKLLQCGHTFCLECLARMNVRSSEPSSLLCPLCRTSMPVPVLGLPKLNTNSSVLSCLPSSMQRVYSVRFLRNKARLQLKSPDAALPNTMQHSLDVGQPSAVSRRRDRGGVGGVQNGHSTCKAYLFLAVIVIFLTTIIMLIIFKKL